MSSIRKQYEEFGSKGYYQNFGKAYRNPHEPIIIRAVQDAVERWQPDLTQVLDLACGSGEITLALRAIGVDTITGVDPYTGEAYLERTGQEALPYTFEDIAAGALAGQTYSLIVCSFAMHLIPSSRLPLLAYHLAQLAPHLLILTPHKRPQLKPAWGWTLVGEHMTERVRSRYYSR